MFNNNFYLIYIHNLKVHDNQNLQKFLFEFRLSYFVALQMPNRYRINKKEELPPSLLNTSS